MGRSKEFEENEVLQKAMELFWRQGYEHTSLNDLVEHMGIHRRSLYDTFGDKHTLFLKVLDCYKETVRTKLENRVLNAKSSKEAIQWIFDAAIDSCNENQGCLFVNSATELTPRDKEIDETLKEVFNQEERFIENLIQKGRESGEFSSVQEPHALAENLINSLIGIRVLARTSMDKEKLKHMANFSLQMLV